MASCRRRPKGPGAGRGRKCDENKDHKNGVRFDKSVQQHLLSDGYFTAALRLLDICTNEMEVYRHVLVFPILFCYRHGFELEIKEIEVAT